MENNTQNEDEEGLREVKVTGGGGDFWNWKSESVRPKAFRRKARIGAYAVSGFYPLEAV
ncbi:hypothetical protein NSS79_25215 [Paenibacillus sp. FSL L8-0436]|uniref:hypothetical protein n=1 Tax=Paenibacillus sp. FSL L8-0436 TaxID=2954686 RepID=UPI0031588343